MIGIECRARLLTGIATGANVRWVGFIWNDDDSNPPLISDVLQTGGSSVYTPQSPLSVQSVRQGKLHILWDDMIAVQANKGDSLYRKVSVDSRVRFNVGITSGTGKFYQLFISDATTVTASGYFCSRVFYDDA